MLSLIWDVRSVSPPWCDLQCAANYCLIIVSMVTLSLISMDRYLAVLYPLRYSTWVTKKRVAVALCWPWLQGFAFAVSPAILKWVHYDYWEAVCAIDWHGAQEQAVYYVIVACILCFGVPGSIMLYCYFHIIREARKCQRHVQPSVSSSSTSQSSQMSQNLKQALKTITSLLVVVVVFFVCMTPFCITKLLKVVISNTIVPGYVNLASSYLEFLASVTNPLIYGVFRRDFRFAYRHLLWHLSCKMERFSPGTFEASVTYQAKKITRKITDYTMNHNKKRGKSDNEEALRDVGQGRERQTRKDKELDFIDTHDDTAEQQKKESSPNTTFNNEEDEEMSDWKDLSFSDKAIVRRERHDLEELDLKDQATRKKYCLNGIDSSDKANITEEQMTGEN